MFSIICGTLEMEGTINEKRYSRYRNIFLTKCWIFLKSAQVCTALFCLLLTTFANGCANLQTALLAPQTDHFRKVRWGTSKASVLLAEQGKRIHFDNGDTLVFKHRHNDFPILLVYCFRKNQLRSAGYLTANPATLKDPTRLFQQELLEVLGEPTVTFKDGGILWKSDETLTYTNTYPAGNSDIHNIESIRMRPVLEGNRISPRIDLKTNKFKNWHGICAYIDSNFYHELNSESMSSSTFGEPSYYEEIMFGIFREIRNPLIKEGGTPSQP